MQKDINKLVVPRIESLFSLTLYLIWSVLGHDAWIPGYVGDLDNQVDERFIMYLKLQFENKAFILLLKKYFLYLN